MLVDDHILIREGIKYLLETDESIVVVGEASDGVECMENIFRVDPDILLIDIVMPRKNGLEILKDLKNINSKIKVLILTEENDVEYLIYAMDLGVDGYILKESDSLELKRAIKLVNNGENYIHYSLVTSLNEKLVNRDIDKDKIELLTKREKEVLIHIANGLFNKEIATFLDISERTVKNHISNIFKKLNVNDRTQAAVFAIKNNIVKIY